MGLPLVGAALDHIRAIHAALATGDPYFTGTFDEDGDGWTVADDAREGREGWDADARHANAAWEESLRGYDYDERHY